MNSTTTSSTFKTLTQLLTSSTLPITLVLILLAVGGMVLLERADRQARDTIRKHHIEDIERSLYFARSLHGTFPPYEEATWCGVLSDPANRDVRNQVEETLRAQHEKYANPDKPFPTDPRFPEQAGDYFYWKRSPSSFELYAVLEADPNGDRSTVLCPTAPNLAYDYGVASIWREEGRSSRIVDLPL